MRYIQACDFIKNKKSTMRNVFAGIILLIGCWETCLGQSSEVYGADDAGVLRGISGLMVVVEDVDPEVERYGLRRNDIQTDVEVKLRTAGIDVVNPDAVNVAAYGYLYVEVRTIPNRSDLFGVSIDVSYQEQVFVKRGDSVVQVFGATTWEKEGGIAVVGKNKLRSVRDFVGDQVNEFINAYLEANPGRE